MVAKQSRLISTRVLLPTFIAATLSALLVIGFLVQQNVYANTQITYARLLDTQGKYTQANQALRTAQSPFLMPTLKTQLSTEQKRNTNWQQYSSYQIAAEHLIRQGKYADALAQLKKIPTDYPSYAAVTKDKDQIATAIADAAMQQPAKTNAATNNPSSSHGQAPTVQPVGNCFASSSISGKRFVTTSAFSSVLQASSVSQMQQLLQSFFDQYGVQVELVSVSPSSYAKSNATYQTVSDSDMCDLRAYAAILVDEWSKYPVDWVHASKLKSIVLVKVLQVAHETRAAMPDIGGSAMYYDITYSGDYAREVIHHEYDHLLTYNYTGSYAPTDSTWTSYNPAGFHYGSGGNSCYVNLGSCPSTEHPQSGFVDFYATTAIEEDKAELYAYLMTGTYYHELKGWIGSDTNLAHKVAYYEQFMASHSPEMSGNYFDQINP